MNSNSSRLTVVDALRGFAIVCIMLLHNIEHFDFYYFPTNLPHWVLSLDKIIWETSFFLFANKAYAIFALLFGLTFFIQCNNQEKIGKDFRARFAWRLFLLLIFGLINSAFFEGDILSIYVVLGMFLIPVAKLSNKLIFWIAVFFLLQPFELAKLIIAIHNPQMHLAALSSDIYVAKINEYIPEKSLFKTMIGNLTYGKIGSILWGWESGRIFQNIALFMLGMLAGRKRLFYDTDESKHFWNNVLIFGTIGFIGLYMLNQRCIHLISNQAILLPVRTIISTLTHFAFMLIMLSSFILLFRTKYFNKMLSLFSYMGRMSLTNYIMQSIMGSFIYYGFGLGLYKYTGATYCLIIGIVLAIIQFIFSYWWMKKHKQGPLEAIWHKGTWLFYNR